MKGVKSIFTLVGFFLLSCYTNVIVCKEEHFVVSSIITALYLLNALIALVAILIKPRDVAAIWAWLLVLFALPGVGFVLYLFSDVD